MSVIVWDGKTLAADKRASYGYIPQTVSKIGEMPGGCFYGVMGSFSVAQELIHWYKSGQNPSDFPSSAKDRDNGSTLIIINRSGEVWVYNSPFPYQIKDSFAAFGSGSDTAYGALEMGADAVRTVEVVCKYNTSCGNGIDKLVLGE